jgi:hypothetical protein
MKYIATAFSIGMITLLFSCKPSNGKKTVPPDKNDSTKISIAETEEDPLKRRGREIELEKIDSIRNDSILQEAIGMAAAKPKTRFSKQYVVQLPDSSSHVDVQVSSDFYFTKEHPHLIIRRYAPYLTYINIFSRTGKNLQQVLSHEQYDMEYTGDTILDINGDHLKDFVVNWYGTNGSWLKAFSVVYLLRPDKRSFSDGFEFINPTFSPKEGVIRGVGYGQPGRTKMYKYRWNGEAIDTVEYIYYEKNDKDQKTGKLIISNNGPDSDNHKVLRRLSAIPAGDYLSNCVNFKNRSSKQDLYLDPVFKNS